MTFPISLSRFALLFAAAALLLAVAAAPSHAQDEEVVTGVEMSEDAIQQLQETEEVDAEAILGMLNEGLFALECASPKKMRAIILFLRDDDVLRVAGDPVEMEPGKHSVADVMPGDRVAEAWEEVTGGEGMRPDTVDGYFPDSIFDSEEEMAEGMREEMNVGDGRIGLVLFLTLADDGMREEMGDALQVRAMGLALGR